MRKQSFLLLSVLCLMIGVISTSFAQTTTYAVDFGDASEVTINGTSTLHDWSIDCQKIGGEPSVLTEAFVDGGTIKDFYFFVEVASMESGRGTVMNRKTVTALKGSEYPNVEYRQTEPATVTKAPEGAEEGAIWKIQSKGALSIGGVSRDLVVDLLAFKGENGQLILKGSKDLTYSQFEIEPPSALFGQIVCGNDLVIKISLALNPVKE